MIKSARVCVFQRVSAPRVGGRGGERTRQCSWCSDSLRQRGRWEESRESLEPFRRAVCLGLGPPTHSFFFAETEQRSSTGAPTLSNISSSQPQPSGTQASMTSDPSQLEDITARSDPLPPSGQNRRELVSNYCMIVKLTYFSAFGKYLQRFTKLAIVGCVCVCTILGNKVNLPQIGIRPLWNVAIPAVCAESPLSF